MCTNRNGLVFDSSEQLAAHLFQVLKGYPTNVPKLNQMRAALLNVEVCFVYLIIGVRMYSQLIVDVSSSYSTGLRTGTVWRPHSSSSSCDCADEKKTSKDRALRLDEKNGT